MQGTQGTEKAADGRATLTVEEAGRRLGISRNHAYDAVKTGEIPAIRIGRRWLVPKVALERKLAGVALAPVAPAVS